MHDDAGCRETELRHDDVLHAGQFPHATADAKRVPRPYRLMATRRPRSWRFCPLWAPSPSLSGTRRPAGTLAKRGGCTGPDILRRVMSNPAAWCAPAEGRVLRPPRALSNDPCGITAACARLHQEPGSEGSGLRGHFDGLRKTGCNLKNRSSLSPRPAQQDPKRGIDHDIKSSSGPCRRHCRLRGVLSERAVHLGNTCEPDRAGIGTGHRQSVYELRSPDDRRRHHLRLQRAAQFRLVYAVCVFQHVIRRRPTIRTSPASAPATSRRARNMRSTSAASRAPAATTISASSRST